MTTSDSRVTDEMVNAAIKAYETRMYKRLFESASAIPDSSADMRAALEAALSAQAPSVAVVDLQKMHDRWVSENYGPGRMAKELRNLISKAGRDE